jgi:hypothetical protein
MDADGKTDHLGCDGGPASPGLYYRLFLSAAQRVDLFHQFGIYGWAFFS